MAADENKARGRYFAMALVRLAGAFLLAIGVLGIMGETTWPNWAVWLALVAGLICIAVIPQRMARRWRTPPE
ncbi:hypothetical protein [Aurantiacibacter aquimixticola]|uniref:DUF2892 domain-containing protein n=1 Tax=Aurantiacibacter aquimixticola TaxID=1958945 RepID=A0A419RTF8_9SPHN|nr:hypothetical protein [Aurantiacibacter aquimixticola]RJY09073.1 hypothetical protein D6201_06590 [Aurantiacibacter aquimixticola]